MKSTDGLWGVTGEGAKPLKNWNLHNPCENEIITLQIKENNETIDLFVPSLR